MLAGSNAAAGTASVNGDRKLLGGFDELFE
jgi:hypothetical protein